MMRQFLTDLWKRFNASKLTEKHQSSADAKIGYHEIDPNKVHKYQSELFAAVKASDLQKVKILTTDNSTPVGFAAFYEAVFTKKFQIAELLLRTSPHEPRDPQGDTLLSHAVDRFNEEINGLEIIEWLLLNGADINARNHNGETPLFIATTRRELIDVATFLLSRNADPRIARSDKTTVIEMIEENIIETLHASKPERHRGRQIALIADIEQKILHLDTPNTGNKSGHRNSL